ncbi:MAG: hypothetical protein J6C17_04525 [Clostridia bacterium]|nr:hypothetical protein [Clostridia bacterium]
MENEKNINETPETLEEVTEVVEEITEVAEDAIEEVTEEAVEVQEIFEEEEPVAETEETIPEVKGKTVNWKFLGGIIAGVVILAVLLTAFLTGAYGNTYMKIDGVKISKGTYNYFLKNNMYSYQENYVSQKDSAYLTAQSASEVLPVIEKALDGFDWNDKRVIGENEPEETKKYKTHKEYVKFLAERDIIEYYSIISDAQRLGISLTDEEKNTINQQIEQLKAQYGANFTTLIEANGFSNEDEYREVIESNALVRKISDKINEDINAVLPEKEVKKIEKYLSDDYITIKTVWVADKLPSEDDAEETVDRTASQNKINEAWTKAKNGDDINEIMDMYSVYRRLDGTISRDRSAMVNIVPEALTESFKNQVFALENGEVTDIVDYGMGYMFAKRVLGFSEYRYYRMDNVVIRKNRIGINSAKADFSLLDLYK